MGFDDACTLLLIHESKLEQAQKDQNVNSVFNANYAHIRGNAKRKGYRVDTRTIFIVFLVARAMLITGECFTIFTSEASLLIMVYLVIVLIEDNILSRDECLSGPQQYANKI